MVQLDVDMAYMGILAQFIAALSFIAFTYIMISLITPKRYSEKKSENFECGIAIQDSARVPFSVKYFLVAILFVLFDVEVVFLYPWAVNFKHFGWFGLFEMTLFITFFLSGFLSIIKRGVLYWE